MSQKHEKLTENDPLITAYVLGELEGAELSRVEEALAKDKKLRASVEQIRVACGAISEVMTHEVSVPAVAGARVGAGVGVGAAVGSGVGASEETIPSWAAGEKESREDDFSEMGLLLAMTQPLPSEKLSRKRRIKGALMDYPGLYFVVGALSAACFVLLASLNVKVEEHGAIATGLGTQKPRAEIEITPENPQLREVLETVADFAPPSAPLDIRPEPQGPIAVTPGSFAPTGPAFPSETAQSETLAFASAQATEFSGPAGNTRAETLAEVPAVSPLLPSVQPGMGTLGESQTDRAREGVAAPLASIPAPVQASPRAPLTTTKFLAPEPLVIAPRSPVFNGFGGGTSRRPFEVENAGADRPFVQVRALPRSELGAQVESRSYVQLRRSLAEGRRPSRDKVQIEQLLNSFNFTVKPADAVLRGDAPKQLVAVQVEYAPAPWNEANLLVRLAMQAQGEPAAARAPERLLILTDDSLSLDFKRILGECLRSLVGKLQPRDQVTFARIGSGIELVCSSDVSGGVWELNSGIETLLDSTRELTAHGAQDVLMEANRATRILLCTAGKPKIPEGLLDSKVPLSVLTLGDATLPSDILLTLAQRGSFRCDRASKLSAVKQALFAQAGIPLGVLVKDAVVTTEFDPELVSEYRIIGYEGGGGVYLPAEPGDLMPGQTFTALYELVLTEAGRSVHNVQPHWGDVVQSQTLLKVRLSYLDAQRGVPCRQSYNVLNGTPDWRYVSDDFKFTAAVAAAGMVMRDSPYRGTASLEMAERWSSGRNVTVPKTERDEFSLLLQRAKRVF